MDELNAIFLFGGVDKVFAELTCIVRERIKKHSSNDLIDLENYLGLEEGSIQEIKKGSRLVSKKMFLLLKSVLGISLQEALGQPDKLNDLKLNEYWKKECIRKPMKLVAYAGAPKGPDIPKNPIDLTMYVTLRAIGEFYRL